MTTCNHNLQTHIITSSEGSNYTLCSTCRAVLRDGKEVSRKEGINYISGGYDRNRMLVDRLGEKKTSINPVDFTRRRFSSRVAV